MSINEFDVNASICKSLNILFIGESFKNDSSLQNNFNNIYIASTLNECVEIYTTNLIDMVIFDYTLFRADVIKINQTLKKINEFIPFLITLNSSEWIYSIKQKNINIDGYLIKDNNDYLSNIVKVRKNIIRKKNKNYSIDIVDSLIK